MWWQIQNTERAAGVKDLLLHSQVLFKGFFFIE